MHSPNSLTPSASIASAQLPLSPRKPQKPVLNKVAQQIQQLSYFPRCRRATLCMGRARLPAPFPAVRSSMGFVCQIPLSPARLATPMSHPIHVPKMALFGKFPCCPIRLVVQSPQPHRAPGARLKLGSFGQFPLARVPSFPPVEKPITTRLASFRSPGLGSFRQIACSPLRRPLRLALFLNSPAPFSARNGDWLRSALPAQGPPDA